VNEEILHYLLPEDNEADEDDVADENGEDEDMGEDIDGGENVGAATGGNLYIISDHFKGFAVEKVIYFDKSSIHHEE
jgi:hypothetical protein